MNRIRELREEKKITQIRLSIELEVSQETISAYENGRHFPSAKSLIRLRELFGVSIDYILGLTDQRYPNIQRSDLAEDEQLLLHTYRKMDSEGKQRLRGYLDGIQTSR